MRVVRVDGGFHTCMHIKLLILSADKYDESLSGSVNLTNNGFKGNIEMLTLNRDRAGVQDSIRIFEDLWKRGEDVSAEYMKDAVRIANSKRSKSIEVAPRNRSANETKRSRSQKQPSKVDRKGVKP